MRRSSRFAVVVGLLVAPALADEIKLRDGRVLVGTVREVGASLRVQTTDGVVTVAASEVLERRTDDELRGAFAQLEERAGDSAFERLELAREARRHGLHAEMWRMLDECLAREPLRAGRDDRVSAFLAELEPVLRAGKRSTWTKERVRDLLARVKPGAPASCAAAVEEILAHAPEAHPFLRKEARSASRPDQRRVALRALARSADDETTRFLYRTMLVDRTADVRGSAAGIVQELGKTADAIAYLTHGLAHEAPVVRIRTAEAFAAMGDAAAAPALVAAGPLAGVAAAGSGGDATRGNIAFLRQESYVRDFNVEVAQASFIADPVVDVLQSGEVLDASVQAVVAYRSKIVGAYRSALQKLTGSDPGRDPAKWSAWWEQRTAPAAPVTGAPGTR